MFTSFLAKYIPHASQKSVHHILIYGCSVPITSPTPGGAWKCLNDHPVQAACQGATKFLYAWAKDAPSLQLPKGERWINARFNWLISPLESFFCSCHRSIYWLIDCYIDRLIVRSIDWLIDWLIWYALHFSFKQTNRLFFCHFFLDVGFQIGSHTAVKGIFMQVHYSAIVQSDNSGISLILSSEARKYAAGIFLFAGGGQYIPPHEPGKSHVFDTLFSFWLHDLNFDLGPQLSTSQLACFNFPCGSFFILFFPVVNVNVMCKYTDDIVIHPFGFRTHAHGLGTVISVGSLL